MKKYNVIYADPPWTYDNKKTGGSNESGACDKYSLMTNKDIELIPIRELIEKDAVCFLWITVPLLPEGLGVLNAWGFKYKTMLTWRKIMSLGMGYWFRGQTEHCILGTRGNVKPFRMQKANFFECKAGLHSQKPDYFRKLISDAVKFSFTEPKKLELFARSREGFFPDIEYEGWDVYGNEVNNSIILPTVTTQQIELCDTKI
jgi:site-specific DNA-methyltransferase (adenine-specific)